MGTCLHPHHHHPEHAGRQQRDPAAIIAAGVAKVRALGMRRTRLLEDVLAGFAGVGHPVTIGHLAERIGGNNDPATLYRMAERLVAAGLLRKIGLQERALYYELVLPGQHRDYLICTRCGAIGDINQACPVDAMEQELSRRTGYTGLHHELVFYGVCPECAKEH